MFLFVEKQNQIIYLYSFVGNCYAKFRYFYITTKIFVVYTVCVAINTLTLSLGMCQYMGEGK